VQVSPLDGATDVSSTLTLDWRTIRGADGYDCEVYEGNARVEERRNLTSSSVAFELQNNRTYRWRVRARVLPQNNAWTDFWTFSTGRNIIFDSNAAQVSPANGAQTGHAPTLRWTSSEGADGYDFEVRDAIGRLVAGYGINYDGGPYRQTSVTVDLGYNTTYRWRVRARILPNGNPWSDYWTITTEDVPGPPQQVSPPSGQTGVAVSVTLDWGGVSGASGYDYQVLRGGTIVAENSGGPIGGTSVRLSFDYGVTYQWRVRARVIPQDNPWSGYWTFTTIPPPGPPVQVSPANGQMRVAVSATLDWAGVSGASGYDYQLLINGTVVAENTGGPIGGTFVSLSLDYGSTYQWRVRARVIPQDNPWSGYWTFTTDAPPGPPAQVSPTNGQTGVAVSMTLDWGGVSGASGYDYQVLLGGNIIAENTGGPIGGTSVGLSLDYGSTYQWRVRARVIPQNNPWSGYWTFSTIPPPGPPVQVSPSNGQTGVAISTNLDWGGVPGASGYDYQLLRNGTVVAENTGGPIGGTSVNVSLNYSLTYQWRVRARVLPQNNAWSGLWQFTTVDPPVVLPGQPSLSSPANNTTGLARPVTLRWGATPNATSYEIEVYYLPSAGGRPLVDRVTVTGTSHITQETLAGRNYAWKVRGKNSSGIGTWSSEWRFATRTN